MTRKLISPLKYQHFAILDTNSPFGILDNMRYDRACPFTESDALDLETFLAHHGEYTRLRIVLTKWSESNRFCWTDDRWGANHLTPCSEDEALNTKRRLFRYSEVS